MSDKIKDALADPDAPWYGSDLVPWVAALLEERDQLKKENERLQRELDLAMGCADELRLREAGAILANLGIDDEGLPTRYTPDPEA